MNQISAFKEYLQQIKHIQPLKGKEETEALNQLAKGGESAEKSRQVLYETNLRLVVGISREYVGFGYLLMELIDAGNEALKKASEYYQPDHRHPFYMYAIFFIRRAFTQMIATKMVRTIEDFKQAVSALHEEHGRPPTNGQVADALDMTLHDLTAHVSCVLDLLPHRYITDQDLRGQDVFRFDIICQPAASWQTLRDDDEQIWWRR